jgi:hypothetical protein
MDGARNDADRDLTADAPRDEGVAEPEPRIEDVEPIHLLANEARERLSTDGFTDEQILEWSEAYFAEHSEGDVDDLVRWIRARQR